MTRDCYSMDILSNYLIIWNGPVAPFVVLLKQQTKEHMDKYDIFLSCVYILLFTVIAIMSVHQVVKLEDIDSRLAQLVKIQLTSQQIE